jgi:hypothetical protein
MRFVGAAKEMERRMNERMLSFKPLTVELDVNP